MFHMEHMVTTAWPVIVLVLAGFRGFTQRTHDYHRMVSNCSGTIWHNMGHIASSPLRPQRGVERWVACQHSMSQGNIPCRDPSGRQNPPQVTCPRCHVGCVAEPAWHSPQLSWPPPWPGRVSLEVASAGSGSRSAVPPISWYRRLPYSPNAV